MKIIILAMLLAISIYAPAQDQRAFFSRDSAGINSIANLVMENSVSKNQFEKSYGNQQHVEFWYRGSDRALTRIHFKFFPDRSAVLDHVDGKFEDLFPFWKKYFQQDADQKVIETARRTETSTPFLNGTAIFQFSKMGSFSRITAIYKVKPSQPDKGLAQESIKGGKAARKKPL